MMTKADHHECATMEGANRRVRPTGTKAARSESQPSQPTAIRQSMGGCRGLPATSREFVADVCASLATTIRLRTTDCLLIGMIA